VKLTLDVLQANDGDCYALNYGDTFILVDGGSRGVYKGVIKPYLDQRRGAKRLDIRMLMISHIDADHITGIDDMFKDLLEQDGAGNELPYRIKSLWFNSFDKLTGGRKASVESAAVGASVDGKPSDDFLNAIENEKARAVVASVAQGNSVRNSAIKLGIPLNPEVKGELVRAPKTGAKKIKVAPGLTFTVLGPNDQELENLDKEWEKSKAKAKTPKGQAADYANRTVPNLSSIVVLVDADVAGGKKKRMLLTGDAGGDLVQEALADAKISKGGKLHVDLLKVQHHGSNHSADAAFFQNITADVYVISGNGKHGIPHPDVLGWISDARKKTACDVYMTNRKGDLGLTENLTTFLKSEKQKKSKIRYHFREDPALSIPIVMAK
jgi:beta-lactamase superfamily II metal-dependent hydrolase